MTEQEKTEQKASEEVVEAKTGEAAPSVEKEAAAPAEAAPEEEIVDERIYTVPLRRVFWTGNRRKRANRAVRTLREFVSRHMKPEQLLIQPEVNERLWAHGIQNPPRKLRIRATKNSENLVRVYLAEG
ncbi:MAG: hypothetical protein C4K49_10260 [Candidatus Thorarchaeota archaeon]|nr:MAG: hypothetical protein C4K49_10260 [Candidatus Thorarchaeota archaeon]